MVEHFLNYFMLHEYDFAVNTLLFSFLGANECP